MDDIFQLLFQSMVIIKEMKEITTRKHYDIYSYIKKQDELNDTLIEIIRLMVFKKE